MKTRLTMRAALALGLPAVARGLGRLKRIRCALLRDAGHEAGRGNVINATVLETWRLRRIAAGLARANARGDANAARRWLARVDGALADLDRAQDRLRSRRRPR